MSETGLSSSFPERTLCVLPQPALPPPALLGKCYISILPDELLAEVFSYLPPDHNVWAGTGYEQCPPIPIICKRWGRLYHSVKYRSISFVSHNISKAVKTLRQQVELRKYIQDICVVD